MASTTFTLNLNNTETSKVHSISLGENKTTAICPPPMVKEHTDSTSPHHLFLASIGACVNLVFEIALEKARISFEDLKSEITGVYDTEEETGVSRFTSIEIDTTLKVHNGVKESRLEHLFEMAASNCPIGNCLVGSCVKMVTNLTVEYL